MTQPLIKDYPLNAQVNNYALMITAIDPRVTLSGDPYITMTLRDASGEISLNLWSTKPEDAAYFNVGNVILIEKGTTTEYKGKKQIKVVKDDIKILPGTHPAAKPELYIETAPIPVADMQKRINEHLAYIETMNPRAHALVLQVLRTHGQEQFYTHPAAKLLHHSFYGGLAYHTLRMLDSVRAVAPLYPTVDASLAMAGVLLHDVGKIAEYKGYIDTDYTIEGLMVGHIAISLEWLTEARINLNIPANDKTLLNIRHIIASQDRKSVV